MIKDSIKIPDSSCDYEGKPEEEDYYIEIRYCDNKSVSDDPWVVIETVIDIISFSVKDWDAIQSSVNTLIRNNI